LETTLAHGLHQRQHVATGDAEATRDPVDLQRRNDQIGVVHGRRIIPRQGESWVRLARRVFSLFMPALRAGIHLFAAGIGNTWLAGTKPPSTTEKVKTIS